MNKFLPLSLTLALAAPAFSQTLDLGSMAQIRQHKIMQALPESNKAKKLMRTKTQMPMTGSRTPFRQSAPFSAMPEIHDTTIAFVRIADGFSADDLISNGYEVRSVYGNIAIVNLRIDDAEALSKLECVKAVQLQRQLQTQMDLARREQGVDDMHHGNPEVGLSVPYTGKGVITGIVDQGVDPNHINFRYADGSSRIEALWHYYMDSKGPQSDFFNYTNIQDFSTDTEATFHGTHTLGILAGSYDGPVQVAKPWANPEVQEPAQLITEDCQYYGVAPQASIAVSCGELQDGFIAYGMEDILNYAEWMRENDHENEYFGLESVVGQQPRSS